MNGSRRYYIGRSQPPLLIQMAATYYTTTNDLGFIKTNILVSSTDAQRNAPESGLKNINTLLINSYLGYKGKLKVNYYYYY